MNLFRRVAILFLSAGSLVATASLPRKDAHEGTRTETDGDETARKVDQVFAAFDKPDSPGCALGVVRDGEFIYKKGYGTASLEMGVPVTPESVFYMGSVSKQFTAASVVLAAEQGYLSLDDDVRKFVPELPSYGKTITLREMLHHTSGFRDVLGLLLLAGRNFEDIHPTPELLDLLSRQKALNYQPGEEFLYSNTNYFLMSVIIHRATHKTLTEFADENIFKPLGMTHTRFYEDHSVVVPGRIPAYEPRPGGGFRIDWSTNFDKVGDGGLLSSVDDLLLWDRNFYDNKLGKGTLLKEMQTQGVLNNGKKIEYALGLFISTYRGLPIVEHGGALFGYRTELLRFPEQKFSVIALCNLGTSSPRHLANQVADIYLEGQLAANRPVDIAAQFDPKPFTGQYRNAESHSVMDVSVVDGDLSVYGLHFKPRDATHFTAAEGLDMNFATGAGGPTQFTLTSASSAPQVFGKFKPTKPSAEELSQYSGEYKSSELQATYRFAVKDGKLTLATNWQEPATLDPSVRDEFQGPFASVVFRRDAAGHVTGCDLFAGRVRDISFKKTTANTTK
jgi:CubicO group peptidase (beta-lactamase class C family)